MFDAENNKFVSIDDSNEFELVLTNIKKRIVEAKDVFHIFWMITKPYKATFFKYINKYLSNEDFSKILIDIWVSCEFQSLDVNVSMNDFLKWFKRIDKNIVMNDEEKTYFKSLPEKVEIFRGVQDIQFKNGISWTSNKDCAIWFAERFKRSNSKSILLSTKVNKNDILLYTNCRGEDEVIINPFKLENIKSVGI